MNARLELLRRRLGQTGPVRAAIPPRPNLDTAPLSASQHRMWLHQRLYPASAAYNVCIRIDLAGALDENRLRDALAKVVGRHEVLRTTYPTGADGRPHQRIHRQLPPPVHIVESADPAQVAREAACQPFDIASSGPIRFHLVRAGAGRWSLVLTVHHIVWDGGCFGVFSHDLGLAYRGDGTAPLVIQYADIAAHEARHEPASSTDLDEQLDHWRRTLTPLPPAPPLPSMRPFGPDVGERAERLDRTLPPSGAQGLRAAAAALRTTPFVVFCAAYALLLRRWTGATDITLGTMVANRHQPGTRELIGNFGNTVLLRLDTSGNPTVRQLVARATHTITGALGNADIAFERVVADLAPPREAGHGFFTDTLCLFLDREIGGPDLPGVDVLWDNVPNGAAPFALTFQGFMNGDLLRVEATYRSELFAPATVHLMLEHLEAILLAAMADPDQPCSAASQLPASQRDHLARLSGGAITDRPAASVLDHWRRLAAATPDRTALVHGGRRFSYGEIDQGANRLAARLIERGVRARDVVAAALSRGPSTLKALLAIWKCGAVHVPLDPRHPKPRLIDLLSQAHARLVIGDTALDLGVPCLVAHEAGPVAIDPGHEPHALEAAHIGFTSGSTGGPKGVVTTHGSLAARTSWVATHWPGGTGGARLAKSAPTAIDAVAELCEAIATGEILVLATDDEARDAAALAQLLETHGIGHFMAVPGVIQAVAIAAPGVTSSRDRVLSTGEPLVPATAGAIHDTAPGVPLYNSYGCTETTGDIAAGRVSAEDAQSGTVPVGAPLPGSSCHVLAPDLTPVPPGALGEVYVGGPQLARGYLAQPALTAARFVASPFEAGGRLYRTGDLARWRDDGRLELAGRGDDQVNVRGHRVEPAEAVEALRALPNVREAAVLPRAVGATMELVAYVAGDGLEPDDGAQLRQRLARTLPGPLVPAEVVVLPHLPRLDGGKIDRQALLCRPAAPRAAAADAPPEALPFKPPQNDREAALAGILCAVLGRPSVGMEDDFFALGGDSLLAVSFAARAHAAGMGFPAATIFQHPTIAQLVRQLPPPRPEKAVTLALPPQTHRFRLSGLPVRDFVTWEPLRGPVDTDRLRGALTETISRHAPLRQAISARGRLWRATTATNGDALVIEIENADAARAVEIAAQAIDVAAGRVIVALVTADTALLVAHPAVIDGLSLARIAGEVDGRTQDPPPPQPAGKTAAMSPAHWDAILGAGPGSPWWVGPDDPPPPNPRARARAMIDTTDASVLPGALLRAVRTLSGREVAVADVEVDPDAIGPLATVPVMGQADPRTIIGDSASYASYASYAAYLSNRRPTAGGPGILIRRTVAPELWQTSSIARGADRLYHIVASWQRLDGRTVLEVAAHEPGVAEALAAIWAAVEAPPLRDREHAHG